MKQAIQKKLKSQKGESLIETMISVMISVAAILLFAEASMTGVKMITTSEDTMDAYYEQNNKLAGEESASSGGTGIVIEFQPTGSGMDLAETQSGMLGSVNVYENTKKSVASYRVASPEENDPAEIVEDDEDIGDSDEED
ncbi:MAG: hypothetical protein IJV04_10005 [Lachnospiraceae bacterium]|nr:hypothetical protein [Lachnospiraceae bacterium]